MKRLALILIPLLFIFTACNDDDSRNGTPDPAGPNYANPHLSGTSVSADYAGRITNNSGAAVANALVQVGGMSAQTNELGFYNITNASTDRDYAVVSVTANGFFKQFRSLKPRSDHKNFVDITLITQAFNGFFEASAGGTVSIPGGASAIFPAGALTDEQGNAYTGQVVLSTTYLNPTDPRLPTYMPGSLQAVDSEGESVAMITYGMIGVELLSGSGEPLKLAQGKKATLEFPVQTEQTAHAPQTIPLWFFDEISGIWREEGMATRIGDKYVGEVSHFSFWNCDIPVPYTTLSGTIINEGSGAPIGNLLVKVTRPNGSIGSAYVGADGYFSGIVPSDELLTLSVFYNYCYAQPLYTMGIGPLGAAPVDLGNIEIAFFQDGNISFSGTVVDCEDIPMEGIIVQMEVSEYPHSTYTVSDALGAVSLGFACASSGTSSITLIDFTGLESVSLNGPAYNSADANVYETGNLSFCETTQLAEYFTYVEGSNEFIFTEIADSTGFGCHNLSGYSGVNNNNNTISLDFGLVTATGVAEVCGMEGAFVNFSNNPNEYYSGSMSNYIITITDFEITDGAYTLLEGTYTADVFVQLVGGGSQNSYTSTASGSFRYVP